MFYLLTHSASLTMNCVFLNEVVEWINNTHVRLDVFMYDDPLDDTIQGLFGLVWAMAFVHCHSFDTSIYAAFDKHARRRLVLYSCVYAPVCAVLMSSAWYVPRGIGLGLYTVFSTGAIYGLLFLVQRDADVHVQTEIRRQVDAMAWVTFLFGVVMTATGEMVTQNLALAGLAVLSCVGGRVGGLPRWAVGVGCGAVGAFVALEVGKFMRGEVTGEAFYYPLEMLAVVPEVVKVAEVAEVAETAERDMGERHGGETLGRGMRERDEGER